MFGGQGLLARYVSSVALVAATIAILVFLPVGHAGAQTPGRGDQERFEQSSTRAQERREARRTRRSGAEAREARRQSRTRFRQLSRREARALARRSFTPLKADVWSPLRLQAGERFGGYRNDFQAEILRDGAEPVVAKTFVPMRDTDTTGAERRVSLDLQEQGTAVVASNPLIDFSLSKSSAGPLYLQQTGITFTPLVDVVEGEI
ncbi:hypothetical protein C7Y72_00015 [Paraconexibacter algicola]|uniref:Uncharacterized protein n=1 Tax=Paraconexibacter algicola TaxID=2133960 RepID=A0A2T4UG03_9ACTN|nr:hypothetical protein C7Y72_00015 [Paraconexibacter algicola]